MAYMNILPDPDNKMAISGVASSGGNAGPGFASVKFSSNQPVMVDRTRSGRVVQRAILGQTWRIEIAYNPLTRTEFNPVNNFLMAMQANLSAFYVLLPQYSAFDASNASNKVEIDASGGYAAGRSHVVVSYSGSGYPNPGDIFNIVDSTNSNHAKTYMVTRYETASSHDNSIGALTGGQKRIHFNPPLTYSVPNDAELEFTNPKIRGVNTKPVQEYSLNTDNLYKFSLNLEEALP